MSTIEHKMTPELKKKLEGLLPVSKAGVKFTPQVFFDNKIPKEFHPVFKQRSWFKYEVTDLLSMANSFTEEDLYEKTRVTILGFDLTDNEGNKIEYKADSDGGCDKEVWDQVHHGLKIACYHNAEKLSGIGVFTKAGLE